MTLFSDDFESGTSDWNLDAGWTTVSEGGNTVLEGSGHAWAVLKGGGEWTDYTFETKVKRISGVVQLLVRLNDEHGRYIVGVTPGGMCLQREAPWGDISSHLDDDYSTPFLLDNWYTIRIDVSVNQIEIYVNGSPRLSFTDPLSHRPGDLPRQECTVRDHLGRGRLPARGNPIPDGLSSSDPAVKLFLYPIH